jgi:adenosylcobinamide-GDP ribazoletransferase
MPVFPANWNNRDIHMPRLLNRYFIAQMFLTRLPVPASLQHSDEELAASTAFFPLVGVLLGAIAAMVYTIGDLVWSHHIAATLAIGATVLLTGAFHEDGLADSADGLGGSFDRNRKLSIMRDSRIGTYGSVALILVLLLKVQSLATIPTHLVPWVIICAHTVARWTSLPLIVFNPYVREEGTGKPFAASVSTQSLVVGTAMAIVISVVCVGLDALLVATGVIAFVWLAQWFLRKQLGGVTGDTLGGVNSCTELLVYMIFAVQL